MCLRCEQDGKTDRHVMPWLTPKAPKKIEHGTLRACRHHWSAGQSLCPPCLAFYGSPDYRNAVKADKIRRLENRIKILGRAGHSTAQLEGRLNVLKNPPPPPVRTRAERTVLLPSVRVPESLVQALRERAERDGVTFTKTTRSALESYLLL